MRHILLSISLLTFAWVSSSPAQMFATLPECDARYGPAVPPTDLTSDVRFYQENGLTIKILFISGKAAVVTFTPAPGAQIEEVVQQKLLDASAAGNAWQKIEGDGPRTWQRSDGLAFAMHDPASGELTLLSTDYLEKSQTGEQTASHPTG